MGGGPKIKQMKPPHLKNGKLQHIYIPGFRYALRLEVVMVLSRLKLGTH